MKQAFTMIELVFVIVIVGIISVMIAPSFQGNRLRQAADQVISHIRYTQHLAMMDNKFDMDDSGWFAERWQIRFIQDIVNGPANCNDEDSYNTWSYMIYTNKAHSNTNPNNNEIAKNPLNANELLSGGYNNTLCQDNTYNSSTEQSMEKMRLGDKYGIDSVTFTGGCRADTMFIHFDHIGRPFNSFPNNNLPYQVGTLGWHRLLTLPCDIILSSEGETETIRIEPETGYTHIL